MTKDKPAIVLPTREIMVEKEYQNSKEAERVLEDIAVVKNTYDQIINFKLTLKSIWYGRWKGQKAEEIISELERISRVPIEDNIVDFVKSSVKRYEDEFLPKVNEIKNQLRQLQEEGVPLLQFYIREEDPTLYDRIKRYFRNFPGEKHAFSKALEICGFSLELQEEEIVELIGKKEVPPARLGRFHGNLNFKRRSVAKELQYLNKKGGSVLTNDNRSLRFRIKEYFKDYEDENCSLDKKEISKALKFAGVEPEEIMNGSALWRAVGEKHRKELIAKELNRWKGNLNQKITVTEFVDENHTLYSRIYEFFKDPSKEESHFGRALRFSGIDPEEVLEDRSLWESMNSKQRKDWIGQKLAEKVEKGELENITGSILYQRIEKEFKDEPGNGGILKKALEHSPVDIVEEEIWRYMTREERKEWIKKELKEGIENGEVTLVGFKANNPLLYSRIQTTFRDESQKKSARRRAFEYASINLVEEGAWRDMNEQERKKWIKKEIRRIKSKDSTLKGIRDNSVLYSRIKQTFEPELESEDSLSKVLSFVDLDPKCLQANKLSPKERVKEALKELKEKGEPLTRSNLRKICPSIPRRVKEYFEETLEGDSEFYNALQSVGVEPEAELEEESLWKEWGESKKKEWIKGRLLELKERDNLSPITSKPLLYSRINKTFESSESESSLLKALNYAGIDPCRSLSRKSYQALKDGNKGN